MAEQEQSSARTARPWLPHRRRGSPPPLSGRHEKSV